MNTQDYTVATQQCTQVIYIKLCNYADYWRNVIAVAERKNTSNFSAKLP